MRRFEEYTYSEVDSGALQVESGFNIAQSFSINLESPEKFKPKKLRLWLNKQNTPDYTLTAAIQVAGSDGTPQGTNLFSGTINTTLLSNDVASYDINLNPTTYSDGYLTGGSNYSIVLTENQTSGTGVDFAKIVIKSTGGVQYPGSFYYSTDGTSTWALADNYIGFFEIWGLPGNSVFSTSYEQVYNFLNDNIVDPRGRYKKKWIHNSMPNVNSKEFNGYPFITVSLEQNEDNPSFDKYFSQNNFRGVITVYSDEATEVDSICDEITNLYNDEDYLTYFKSKSILSSPFRWDLDLKGKKIMWRELTFSMRRRQ